MQPTTQLPYEQKYSMSWGQFISSVLFAFFGTGLITVFLAMPLTIYTAGLENKKQIALYESIANTASIGLQLTVLLFFIFKFEPAKNLLLKSFNFKALKEWRTYVYLLLFFAISIVLNYIFLKYVFQDATKQQASALNLDVFEQYQILLLIGFAILTPIFEELIFRGFLLHFFSERFPFWIAAVLTSFFFGIAHTYSLGVMVITFFTGLLMAILCKKTKSIIPAMLFHIMNNMLAFLS
ncbi:MULTISPECIES: CPBP family intramembrane glutamic endopeptidase [Bacillus]|uniref:CPBP family intramembrane metalloprotease n=1 Tax=Bacillus toyonensis TaxID=155322 RepID=A0A2B6G263_9BACI|nr:MULTISPECIES: CPBP family intramembrane glutamic endopeptidase [Bacillus]EOP21225.1 CAAX amino protease [Bacillus cereus VD131]KNH42045.1 CAAX protease [Bacillus thuringiensis]OTX31352.1 CPBP family intramembrane metalloprotease [Bacillus thuringiensis serovar malayensis]OUB11556.1 CAAX protease family protein [Bacillus thuringiensis serovar shandongiensis]AXK20532.1 CPBP family intramembrane metalloprotease [Bacillus sp. COPE52]